MKDVVLISTWPPAACGIATYSQALVNAHRASGLRVTVLAEIADIRHPTQSEPGVFSCWARDWVYETKYGLGAIPKAIRSSEKKPDIVHIQHEFGIFPDPNGFLKLISELLGMGIKVAITFHTVPNPPQYKLFFRALPHDAVVFVHNLEAASILSSANHDKVYTIPHGVEFNDEPKQDSDDHYFLCPGFISRSKGIEMILDAYYEASIRKMLPQLRIMGLCRDENYLEQLQRKANGLFVGKSVMIKSAFLAQDTMKRIIRNCTAVILGHTPGRSESGEKKKLYSSSGQLALALGTGKAIIASDAPIYRRGGGILYYDTPGECARHMMALVSNPTLKMGLEERSLLEATRASWHDVAEEQIKIMNSA